MIAIQEKLLKPIAGASKGYRTAVTLLALVALWGLFAWIYQITRGLGVTGMNKPVLWGIYMVNFIFFVGVAHAGALVSAVLRLSRAEWRRPFTRLAEAVTVFSLPFAALSIFADLGRPDRFFHLVLFPRLNSPILWDVMAVTLYFLSSLLFFYYGLIPDIALCRGQFPSATGLRGWFYRKFARTWRGTPEETHRLNRITGGFSVWLVILVVAVSTVVSWVFGLSYKPGWHTAIFGPYFITGALFSGVAVITLVAAAARRSFGLGEVIKPVHFDNLGKLLLTLGLVLFYLTVAEYVTTFYGAQPEHMAVLSARVGGQFAPLFWSMIVLCFVIPLPMLFRKKTRTVRNMVIASVMIVIGMWIERFIIMIPPQTLMPLPYPLGHYTPTWVEWSITAAFLATFTLLLLGFTRIFPIVSVWELKEGKTEAPAEVQKRVAAYQPEV